MFVLPFVWLLVTSLKPIEQSMSLPPTWIPRAYYAKIDGVRLEVTRDFEARQAGVLAAVTSGEHAGQLVFLSAKQFAERADARVVHPVEMGWVRVTEKLDEKTE